MVTPHNRAKEAPLLSGVQTVESIRDTGYKGPDYALAELIDNSFQWGDANTVLLVIVQRTVKGRKRATKQADEIWVIDDGKGMTDEALNLALSFGGSGNYNDRSGIGRFGMGLPQASVSQCKRTDVWTWQNSQPENASHTYLDLAKVSASPRGSTLTVPWPTDLSDPDYQAMPDWVIELCKQYAVPDTSMGQPLYSGTAIRWTTLDRIRWTTAEAILRHTEHLLGRVYRNFLTSTGRPRQIKIAITDRDTLDGLIDFHNALPNDPLYLLAPDQTTLGYWEKKAPEAAQDRLVPVTDTPPFTEYQEARPFDIRRPDGQGTSQVRLRLSSAKPEARPGRNAGQFTHQGRHAKDNVGISVVRAGRELLLETTLAQEPTDRWWGIELSFDADLDEVFGVTNNKQDVPNLTQALKLASFHGYTKQEAVNEGLFDEDHPIAELYHMAHQIIMLRKAMKAASKNAQTAADKAHQAPPSVAGVASVVKSNRAAFSPTPGEKEFAKTNPDPAEAAALIDNKMKQDDVSEEIRNVVLNNYKRGVTVHVIEQPVKQTSAFFWPDEALNLEYLFLNNAHPAYESLIEPLRISGEQIQDMTEEEAKRLLTRSADTLTWLLVAWSRCENEYRGHNVANMMKQIRDLWGQRLAETVEDNAFKAAELFGEASGDEDEGDEGDA